MRQISYDNPYDILKGIAYRRFPLLKTVCVPNGYSDFIQNRMPYIGHNRYLSQLEAALRNNDSGSFLVTGFRGVGKTVLVQTAVHKLSEMSNGPIIKVDINFSVQREYIEVLFELTRKLHDAVKNSSVWYALPKKTRNQIELVNQRTFMGIQYSQERSAEIGGSITAKTNPETIAVGFSPKIAKKYSEVNQLHELTAPDIELEFIKIVEQIKEASPQSKVIVVFDEIDKLTQDEIGTKCFEGFLSRSKSIITDTRTIFIFIAGVDVYEKWEEDSPRIDSLYDSLFSWHLYLPCIWDTAVELFDLFQEKKLVFHDIDEEFQKLVRDKTVKELKEPFRLIDQFLIFMGKGLPRRIMRLFDSFIERVNGAPYFVIKTSSLNRLCLINELYQKFFYYQSNKRFRNEIDRDTHYIVFLAMLDYLVGLKCETFTEAEIKKSLLIESGLRTNRLVAVCNELLKAFQSEAIIRVDPSKQAPNKKRAAKHYYISDSSIQGMKKGAEYRPASGKRVRITPRSLAELTVHNYIKKTGISEIEQYFKDYTVESLLSIDNGRASLLLSNSDKDYLAVTYDLQNPDWRRRYSLSSTEDVFKNESIKSPLFSDATCLIVDNALFSIISVPDDGILLSELATAGIKPIVAYRIIDQIFEFAIAMKEQDHFRLPVAPDELLICKKGVVKIIKPVNIYWPGFLHSMDNHTIFCAPEDIADDKNGRTIVYSIGMLLLFLFSDSTIDCSSTADAIHVNSLVKKANCSSFLKHLIASMICFDIDKRPALDIKLWKRVKKCPDFWRYAINRPVRGIPQSIAFQYYYRPNSLLPPQITSIGEGARAHTVAAVDMTLFDLDQTMASVLEQSRSVAIPNSGTSEGGSTPIMQIKRTEAFLRNDTTNEIIPINVSPFTVGRSSSDCYAIPDRAVSKEHLKIELDNGQYYLSSNAVNGVILNGEKVENIERVQLNNNTVIQIGNTILIFERSSKGKNAREEKIPVPQYITIGI